MADIRVERKNRPNWWIWLIGLLVLGLVIWLIAGALDGETDVEQVPTVTDRPIAPPTGPGTGDLAGAVPAEVDQYLQFVQTDTAEVDAEMGRHHEYTSRGIELLTGALSAMVDRYEVGDIEIEARRDTLLQRAEAIQEVPTSLQHANKVRNAFVSVADLMESIQQKRHPDLASDVTEVRQAAQTITPQEPLLDQRDDVRTFFEQAGETLQRMTGATATS